MPARYQRIVDRRLLTPRADPDQAPHLNVWRLTLACGCVQWRDAERFDGTPLPCPTRRAQCFTPAHREGDAV